MRAFDEVMISRKSGAFPDPLSFPYPDFGFGSCVSFGGFALRTLRFFHPLALTTSKEERDDVVFLSRKFSVPVVFRTRDPLQEKEK